MAGPPDHLLLFDVDSVLVDALGYLKALQDTVAHFSRQLGVGDHPPSEHETRTFEAYGLTSEWDSGAACVGQLLVERLRREPDLPLPASWPEAMSYLGARPCPLPHQSYGPLTLAAGERIERGATPAQAARQVLLEVVDQTESLADQRATLALLLDTLLGHTHDYHRAPVTRYLQHLAIGSEQIPATYGVSPDIESPPYLLRYDRPLLTPAWRERLRSVLAQGLAGAAIYTARPSLPPADVDGPTLGFSPEAEAARSLVELEGIPLIGAGKMRWLASRTGEELERLVKPSPVQALAAIGAASSGHEASALDAALRLHRDGDLRPPLADLGAATVHVFEDTVAGLAAVERAAAELRALGLPVGYEPYGVVRDGPKASAMADRGLPTFPSVSEALATAIVRVSGGERKPVDA
jgi:hypothetical protein